MVAAQKACRTLPRYGQGATDAQGKEFHVNSLNDYAGLITGLGNGYPLTKIFHHQLKLLANPGDLLLTWW